MAFAAIGGNLNQPESSRAISQLLLPQIDTIRGSKPLKSSQLPPPQNDAPKTLAMGVPANSRIHYLYPKGIAPCSPRLRGTSHLGKTKKESPTPKWVADFPPNCRRPQNCRPRA